jgi:hypothetical protein
MVKSPVLGDPWSMRIYLEKTRKTDAKAWLSANIKHGAYRVFDRGRGFDTVEVYFRNDEDAVLFRIAFSDDFVGAMAA